MSATKGEGPVGWAFGPDDVKAEITPEGQAIIAEMDARYDGIFNRIPNAMAKMIASGDGDALLLLWQTLVAGAAELEKLSKRMSYEVSSEPNN